MSDYYLWLENTATKIKLGLFNEIDSDRLIEEIEDMGALEKRSLDYRIIASYRILNDYGHSKT